MKVHILPFFRGPDQGEGGIRRVVEAQARYLPDSGIEVVSDMAEADLVASHASNIPRLTPEIPWVVHCHGLYWSEYEWPAWCHRVNAQIARAMHQADAVTAPSEWVAQAIRRGSWINPAVIGHGIDPEDWKPTGECDGYILWNKTRVDSICDPGPVAELAGRMPMHSIVTTFGGNGMSNVREVGCLPGEDAKRLVERAGVYLCTTRETFGIGTIEAMACGVPVVGWRWGGQREIVTHGMDGWLAEPGDIDGLVEGIEWALQNRQEIGEAAREVVLRRWTWERVMPAYAELYQGIWDGKSDEYHRPRTSVVIPCHNLGKYLPATVDSLLTQDDQDWEAVIVDDASTDDSAKVAALLAMKDKRIRVLKLEQNHYLAGALNAGIKATGGRLVMPLDADNMLAPGSLKVLADQLDRDRGSDIAYGSVQFVLEDGVTPDQSVGQSGFSGWPPSQFNIQWQLMQRNQIPSTSLYRRKVWNRVGGYRRRWRTSEDADFWTRATSLGFVPVKQTEAPHLIYRQREGSMSRSHRVPNYSAWLPWAKNAAAVPWVVPGGVPPNINGGAAWRVPSFEPTRVAVIICVGPGHGELVIDALDSVQAQTYPNWECVVVNDTGAALDVPHPWATVMHTTGQVGPANARNLGVGLSSSPYVLPLDADDFLDPQCLERLVETGRECPDAVIYGQWWEDFGNEGTRLYDPPEYSQRSLLSKGCIHAVSALYPRASWVEVGGMDGTLSHWEDWDFQIRLAVRGICSVKIDYPTFTYRKLSGQRREENYAAIEQGKNAILARWGDLWEGRQNFMPCRGCGGRVAATPPLAYSQQQGGQLMTSQRAEHMQLIQYVGQKLGTRTFRGKVTNTRYNFGPGADSQKFVYNDDVPGLLALGTFRQPVSEGPDSSAGGPVLAADGPPQGYEQPGVADAVSAENQGSPTTVAEMDNVSNYSVSQMLEMAPKRSTEDLQKFLEQEQADQQRKTMVDLLEREIETRRETSEFES